jgi:hypothetical protein
MKQKINLTEELYRMRKLMNYTIGETSTNLVVEQPLGKKSWRLGLKFWPGAKGFGSGGWTFTTIKGEKEWNLGFHIGKGGSQIVDEKGYKGKIETDPKDDELTGWKEFLETDDNMVKRMSSTSKSNWKTLKEDPEHIGYAVYSLEEFNRTFDEYKWQYVFCNTEDGIKEELKEISKPTEEEVTENFNAVSLPIEFPLNGPSNTFFKDNEWAPTDAFANSLEEEVLGPLREIKGGLNVPEGEPVFFLAELEIITSCSRFRNTGVAKELTFKQLSENRNNSAKEFILNKLKELGVVVDGDTSITQNSDGENGDGSSGPNTPEGLYVATDGKESTALPPNSKKARDERDKYGTPIKDKTAYDDYKYCIVGMSILANTKYNSGDEELGDEDEEPKMDVVTIDVPTKEYNVSFYSKPKYVGISFRIPKIIGDWQKRNKRNRSKKPKKVGKTRRFGTVSCPKF